MRALHIRGAPYRKVKHSAGTDAVRCLAVIAGLLSDIHVDVSVLEARKGPRLCTHLPRLTSPRPHSIRITTFDGGWLPDYTPNKLVKVFGSHGGLIAVGLNRNGGREVHNKFWWLQFEANKFLEDSCTQANGSIIDGVKLCVLRIDVPDKAQLRRGSQSMRKCENTGRERRDWQADILALDNLMDKFDGDA
ncbi:hypothetical protein BS50DRAFT_582435 [Corynespora cassiicola Philippines]|uniref:Uncharacterized protein n=1 Tax=Corynespora cassiicola Philippines TaxID=1448308 RepID=A0A2T2P518_CORCC|nr:hypothetical protein BS50DRAFT_582435 [Corynespora cassiicola Philippines]